MMESDKTLDNELIESNTTILSDLIPRSWTILFSVSVIFKLLVLGALHFFPTFTLKIYNYLGMIDHLASFCLYWYYLRFFTVVLKGSFIKWPLYGLMLTSWTFFITTLLLLTNLAGSIDIGQLQLVTIISSILLIIFLFAAAKLPKYNLRKQLKTWMLLEIGVLVFCFLFPAILFFGEDHFMAKMYNGGWMDLLKLVPKLYFVWLVIRDPEIER